MIMEYRHLGKSGLQLSALSFGSWVTFHKQLQDGNADELMGIAYDNGINFFDNAEAYAGGESEKMMGRVLRQKAWDRTSYVLSSKVFFGWRGKQNKPNQTGLGRKHVVEACHEALQRLQVDYLDLFFCHRPDKSTPIAEVVWTMNILLGQGKILYWGTSEWSGVEILEAHRIADQHHLIGPTMEQPQYNLLERQKMENEYLEIFKTIGLGTTVWSPLASGLLTGKYNQGIPEGTRLALSGFEWLKDSVLVADRVKKVAAFSSYARALGTSPATLALAWCLKNDHVSTVILGATKKEQLLENLRSMDLVGKLSPEVMEQIETIMQTKPALPAY
jgi:voltage-dependent potassium channel beta subunit